MQKWRVKAWSILLFEWHQSRVYNSVYLDTQGGEGVPDQRTHFTDALFVLNQEQYGFHFANVWNSSTWGRNYKIRPLAHSFDGGLPSLSVYLGRHWRHSHDKMDQAFLLRFCILEAIKTGRWESLGTRLLHSSEQVTEVNWPNLIVCRCFVPIVQIVEI